MPALPDLQADLLRAVLDGEAASASRWVVENGIAAEARLGVYANNSSANFLHGLRLSFPVIRRLGGDAYFDQCAASYRERHPSRSGDLAAAGAAFPGFLAERHRDDRYRYFGAIARLEWLYQEALAAADHAPLDLARLAAVPPSDYERLRFELHPAARLLCCEFPVLAIWEANLEADREPDPIDLDQGGERLLLTRTRGRLFLHRLDSGDFAFLQAIERREPLAAAVAEAENGIGDDGIHRHDGAFDAAVALRKFVQSETIVDFGVD